MKIIFKMLILLSLFGAQAFSKEMKISDISFSTLPNKTGKAIISFNRDLSDTPELTLKGSMIQLAIPNVVVWPKIQKRIKVNSKFFNGKILAYQFDKNLVRFRIHLPYSIENSTDLISVEIKNKKMEITFPIKKNRFVKNNKFSKSKTDNEKSLSYDEKYLEKLLRDKEGAAEKNGLAKKNKGKSFFDEIKKDRISTKKSSFMKGKKEGLSIMSYIGKFVGFLGIILLVFYGIATFLKKGVSKRGKLGFLNREQLVEVLSTTYIAPKRNLMVVRVHDQILLLGNSENGISMISEVKDTSAFIKKAEKIVSGNNFDTKLEHASTEEKDFKLKENIELSSDGRLGDFLSQVKKDVPAKLSEKIKNKVKGLKSLQ